jgi:hypothetical protein
MQSRIKHASKSAAARAPLAIPATKPPDIEVDPPFATEAPWSVGTAEVGLEIAAFVDGAPVRAVLGVAVGEVVDAGWHDAAGAVRFVERSTAEQHPL